MHFVFTGLSHQDQPRTKHCFIIVLILADAQQDGDVFEPVLFINFLRVDAQTVRFKVGANSCNLKWALWSNSQKLLNESKWYLSPSNTLCQTVLNKWSVEVLIVLLSHFVQKEAIYHSCYLSKTTKWPTQLRWLSCSSNMKLKGLIPSINTCVNIKKHTCRTGACISRLRVARRTASRGS